MKEYILSIAGVIVLTSVISIILPNGKIGSFIKGISKLLVLTIMITPMFSWLKTGEFVTKNVQISLNEGYIDYCLTEIKANREKEISRYVSENFDANTTIAVTLDENDYTIKKITVKIIYFGINGQDGHIHIIEKLKKSLSKLYGCEVEVYDESKITRAMGE